MKHLTNNRLSSVTFSQDDIAKIIQNLGSGKAHGHDNISIRMLKICGSAIYEPSAIIFKQCVDTGIFPSEWKKGNIVFIHEKAIKRYLNIIVQYRYSLFVEKFLNDQCLMKC